MALQYSDTVRNARSDATETAIGVSPMMRLRSGAPPANCAAADAGTVIATLLLPADFMNNAAAGVKTKLGTWEDLAADAAGVIGHFRIYNNAGTVCHIQGTVTLTGGGGDMTVDNTNVTAGQQVTVSAFQTTSGNA
jgi:hypothetical protein